jgi:hypothetical protein
MKFIIAIIIAIIIIYYVRNRSESFENTMIQAETGSRVQDQRGRSSLIDPSVRYPLYTDMINYGYLSLPAWREPNYKPQFPVAEKPVVKVSKCP